MLRAILSSCSTEWLKVSSSLLAASRSLLATSRSLLVRSTLVRLRTSSKLIPKSNRLTATPLASTKAGTLLSAPFSNFGKVAKYRLHSRPARSEEHTSELQSRQYLVCRLLLEKKKKR